MDLALPRDIDFKIKELENANVYCIDDLKAIQNKMIMKELNYQRKLIRL